MRPGTLAEVAQLTAAGASFNLALANFLDEFYAAPKASRLSTEPDLLEPNLGEQGRVQDAYLAAVAEHLAYTHSLPIPSWVRSEDRKLHHHGLPLNSTVCGPSSFLKVHRLFAHATCSSAKTR
jgi:hypothetical protein